MSDKVPKPIELNLSTDTSADSTAGDQGSSASGPQTGPHVSAVNPADGDRPVMGWIAATFGVLSIFVNGVVFVPLGLVCSVIALFMGQGMWAVIGLFLALIGLVTSPILLGILGLSFLASWLGF